MFFFSFSLTWDHTREKIQTTSPLKVHNRFTPKEYFCQILTFFINMGLYHHRVSDFQQSFNLLSRNRLAVEQNGPKFRPRWYLFSVGYF